jgi:hypothetical protein
MSSFKIATIVLALGFAAGIGCGSDGGTKTPDTAIIGGTGGVPATGGSVGLDAGVGGAVGAGGAGGSVGVDASIATGGAGGGSHDGGGAGGSSVDGNIVDAPITIDSVVGPGLDGSGGEVASVVTICTGLTPDQCNSTIINAAVDSTVTVQDPPITNPPDYLVCSQ